MAIYDHIKKSIAFEKFSRLPKKPFFSQKNCLPVLPDDLRDGDRLVIGLKSPHGKGIRLSNAFIEHISTFSARILVLVVPLESIIPKGYAVILEDRQICNVRDTFYDPSSNRSLLQAEAGDYVFRVLVRSDLKHSVFEMNGSAGEKYWEEVPIPGIR